MDDAGQPGGMLADPLDIDSARDVLAAVAEEDSQLRHDYRAPTCVARLGERPSAVRMIASRICSGS